MTGLLKNSGEVRTDMDCHACSKQFIALLDYSVDGNHVIECPHCRHEHCRVIKGGKITGERWDSRNVSQTPVSPRRVWKSDVLQVKSTMASQFIRDRWLNRSDFQ